MKALLIFILCLPLMVLSQVPDTDTFSQSDVEAELGLGATTLSDCFTNSDAAKFDADYGSKTMNPQKLSGFRNYGASCRPAGLTQKTLVYTFLDQSLVQQNVNQATLELSKSKCYTFNSEGCQVDDYYTVQYSSMAVGQTVYLGTGTDCNTVSSGYFMWSSGSNGVAYDKIVTIASGVVTAVTNGIQAGDSRGGGIVGYVFQSGDGGYDTGSVNGVIISSSDATGTASWGCSGLSVTTSTGTGSGSTNTYNIDQACSDPSIAAQKCLDYSSGGFSDWQLGSVLDMSWSMTNLSSYFVSSEYYWTSSQYSSTNGYALIWTGGPNPAQSSPSKTNTYKVKPVRYF